MGQWYVRGCKEAIWDNGKSGECKEAIWDNGKSGECKEAIWDNGKSGGVKRPYGTMVRQGV